MVKLTQSKELWYIVDISSLGCYCSSSPLPGQFNKDKFSCSLSQECRMPSGDTHLMLSKVEIGSAAHVVGKVLVIPHRSGENCVQMKQLAPGTWGAAISSPPCKRHRSGKGLPAYRLVIAIAPTKMMVGTMGPDFGHLLTSGLLADFEFCVQGETLKAHTQILAGRSSVLGALMSHNCIETETRTMVIDDVSAQTFGYFLTYLYSEVYPDTEDEATAVNLFILADKYDVESLKVECEMRITNQLSVANVVSILQLSYLHSSTKLRDECLMFVIRNSNEVLCQPEWHKLGKDCPRLFFSACEFLLRCPVTESF